MLNLILNNPFRFLGVFSNASKKEITANATRAKAFLKVNKPVEFPLDLSQALGSITRSLDDIEGAVAKLNLPEDKILHSLFWFVNASPLDATAINNFAAGNDDKALEILGKKECFSSVLNKAIMAFVKNDLQTAISLATAFIHNDEYRTEFVNVICGETFSIDEETLSHKFIDALLLEIPADKLYKLYKEFGSSASDDEYLEDKAAEVPISRIVNAVEKAKKIERTNAIANYNAGIGLINSTKGTLAEVKAILGEDDLTYQRTADTLAQAILQCGINYFNNTDDEDDVEKALYIQSYALKVAVGSVAKDRCQKNVDILKKKKEEGKIKDDVEYLADALKTFKSKSNSISTAKAFVEDCKPHLANMASALGATNDLYLQISSAIANNALGMLISVVNDAQSGSTPNFSGLKSTINTAMECMTVIGSLAMTAQERTHFNNNKNTLSNMKSELDKLVIPVIPSYTGSSRTYSSSSSSYSSSSSSSSSGDDTNWGCIIAAVIGFILFIIMCAS